jgi:hypothetical protein
VSGLELVFASPAAVKVASCLRHERLIFLLVALGFILLVPGSHAAAQFVELEAEIELNDWSYRFQNDKLRTGVNDTLTSIFTTGVPIRCVVGTNMWLMESDFFARNAKVTRWFTAAASSNGR